MSTAFTSGLTQRETVQQAVETQLDLGQKSPLDETRLRQIETELIGLTGCQRAQRAIITVLDLEQFRAAQDNIVPERLKAQGLANHFNALTNPENPRQVFLGPSALAGLNDRHTAIVTEVIYALLAAYGAGTNLAFDRGCTDLLAEELGRRAGLEIYTAYPAEREFVKSIIEASRPSDSDFYDCVGLLKRNPRQFFADVKRSTFYTWWASKSKGHERLSKWVDLLGSLSSPNAQLEGSFMRWAGECANVYATYRTEQARRGALGAAKRWEGGA